MARWSAIACLILMYSTSALAQESPSCSYSDCGLLRVNQAILAGQEREEIASFGALSPPDLRSLFQSSDSALLHFDIAEANYQSGKIMSWLGLALVFGGSLAYEIIDEPGSSPSIGEWIALGVGVTGAGFTFWGDRRVKRARRAVDEGIWWYNGSLRSSP